MQYFCEVCVLEKKNVAEIFVENTPRRQCRVEIVETFESTCSVLDKNIIRNFYVSTAVGVSES